MGVGVRKSSVATAVTISSRVSAANFPAGDDVGYGVEPLHGVASRE